MNALLGVQSPQPQVAQARDGFRFPPVGERQKAGDSGLRRAAPVERGLQTATQPQVIPPTDGGLANVQGFRDGPSNRFLPPGEVSFERPLPNEATTTTFPGGPADGPVQPNREAPITPLEGELLPPDVAQAQYNLQAPQGNYGLSGAEDALTGSALAQQGALRQGAQDAFGIVGGAFDQARGDVTGQLGAGLGALRAGVATGRGDISSARDAAIGYLDPYESTGQAALQREAALSGALGPEAQQAAFDAYTESPGQQFFRDRQEQALLRNAAATGQTGSGNVLTALQEQAQGIAAQNYQQDLENLRSLAGRGQQAATTQGGYQQQAGSQLANLAFQGGAAELGARQQAGSTLAGLAAQRGLTQGNILQGLGRDLSGVYGQTGANIAGLRSQAGQQIAQQLGLSGQQLAQLQSGLGQNLANIDQQTAANLANLSAQYGQGTSGLRTGLAALLANLATGSGSQQANLATQLGGAQAAGVTNPIGNTISQLLGLGTAYLGGGGTFGGGLK